MPPEVVTYNTLVNLIGDQATLVLIVLAVAVVVFFEVRARRSHGRTGAPRTARTLDARRAVGERIRAGLHLVTLAAALAVGPGRTSGGRAAALWTVAEIVTAGLGIGAFYLARRAWLDSARDTTD